MVGNLVNLCNISLCSTKGAKLENLSTQRQFRIFYSLVLREGQTGMNETQWMSQYHAMILPRTTCQVHHLMSKYIYIDLPDGVVTSRVVLVWPEPFPLTPDTCLRLLTADWSLSTRGCISSSHCCWFTELVTLTVWDRGTMFCARDLRENNDRWIVILNGTSNNYEKKYKWRKNWCR